MWVLHGLRAWGLVQPWFNLNHNATQKLHQTKYYDTFYTDKVYPIHFAQIRFYICADQLNFINFVRMWTKVRGEHLPRAQQTLQSGAWHYRGIIRFHFLMAQLSLTIHCNVHLFFIKYCVILHRRGSIHLRRKVGRDSFVIVHYVKTYTCD